MLHDVSSGPVFWFCSELAGGFTEVHRWRGAAGHLRRQTDGSWRRPSLSDPGEWTRPQTLEASVLVGGDEYPTHQGLINRSEQKPWAFHAGEDFYWKPGGAPHQVWLFRVGVFLCLSWWCVVTSSTLCYLSLLLHVSVTQSATEQKIKNYIREQMFALTASAAWCISG